MTDTVTVEIPAMNLRAYTHRRQGAFISAIDLLDHLTLTIETFERVGASEQAIKGLRLYHQSLLEGLARGA